MLQSYVKDQFDNDDTIVQLGAITDDEIIIVRWVLDQCVCNAGSVQIACSDTRAASS